MRLWIFGGTGFESRYKTGNWSPIAPESLMGAAALEPGRISFGVGRFDNRPPFIIFRELQNAASRGGYPLLVLLEPERAVWEEFDWNAAHLMSQILSDEPLSTLILKQPETIEKEKIAKLFLGLKSQKLPGADRSGQSALSKNFESLLVGHSLKPQPLKISMSDAGLSEAPSLIEIAGRLENIPQCFVTSGWLIVGDVKQAAQLGASLTINTEAAADQNTDELILRGKKLLDSWRIVRQSKYADALAENSMIPVDEWPENAEKFADRLDLLARLIAADESTKKSLTKIQSEIAQNSILATELKAAFEDVIHNSQEPFDNELTVRTLTDALENEKKLSKQIISRLNIPATVEFLSAYAGEKKMTPADPGKYFDLPFEVLFQVWKKFIENEETAANLPHLLIKAVGDLKNFEGQSMTLSDLIEIFLTRTEDLHQTLYSWRDLVPNPKFGSVLESALARRWRENISKKRPHWGIDFLMLDASAGDYEISSFGFQTSDFDELIRELLNVSQSSPEHGPMAAEWLRNLAASSETRLHLSITSKLSIANRFPENWPDFAELQNLLRGGKRDKKIILTAEQKPILARDLKELLKEDPASAAVPNLAGLADFFDSLLPDETAFEIFKLKPVLTAETAEDWLAGWQRFGKTEIEEAELCRALIEGNFHLAHSLAAVSLVKPGIGEILANKILFSEDIASSELCRKSLVEMLTADPGTLKFRRILISALLNELRKIKDKTIDSDDHHRRGEVFAARFVEHKFEMGTLLAYCEAGEKDEIINKIFQDEKSRELIKRTFPTLTGLSFVQKIRQKIRDWFENFGHSANQNENFAETAPNKEQAEKIYYSAVKNIIKD